MNSDDYDAGRAATCKYRTACVISRKRIPGIWSKRDLLGRAQSANYCDADVSSLPTNPYPANNCPKQLHRLSSRPSTIARFTMWHYYHTRFGARSALARLDPNYLSAHAVDRRCWGQERRRKRCLGTRSTRRHFDGNRKRTRYILPAGGFPPVLRERAVKCLAQCA